MYYELVSPSPPTVTLSEILLCVTPILIGYLIRVRVGGARSSRARPGTGFENSFTALQAFYPELTSPGVGLQSLCSPV